MSKPGPSQVVLVRRVVDRVIDNVADEITERGGKRDRTMIAVFGRILDALYEPLVQLQRLQQSGQREIPSDLREMLLETEPHFESAMKDDFEELKAFL